MPLEVRPHFLHSSRMEAAPPAGQPSGSLLRGIALAALLTGIASAVLAQDAGALLRQQQRQRELQPPERLPQPEAARAKPAPAALPATADAVLIKRLRFTGKVELLPPAERERYAAAIENQRASLGRLRALVDEVTFALQQQGRVLARATLPPQDITAGVVTVDIAEGRLEPIQIERGKGARIRPDLLQAIGQAEILPDSVSKQALEEALLRMNDLPGVSARGRLMQGTAANTSRLVVGVEQAAILAASVWDDNYGNVGSGRVRGNGLVTVTDLSGLGDHTSLAGFFSQGQKYAQAEFSVPLRSSGVTFRVGYDNLSYRNIDELGRRAGLEGYAHQVETGLNYTVVRSRQLNLRLSSTFARNELVDDAIAGRLQDKRGRSANVALAGDLSDTFGGGALTSWSLGATWGNLDLSRVPAAQAVDAAGLHTQGSYRQVRASVFRLQALARDFAVYTRLYGQWASKNLDSSEDFALGGPYGVRGWPVGEGRGDMGLLGTLELHYDMPAPAPWKQVQLIAFLDGGRVRTNTNPNGVPLFTACGCNTYNLAGAGLGIHWAWQELSFAAVFAHGIGDNPGQGGAPGALAGARANRWQSWLQGAIRF